MGSCEGHMPWGLSAEGMEPNRQWRFTRETADPGASCIRTSIQEVSAAYAILGLEAEAQDKSGRLGQDGSHLLVDAKGLSAISNPLKEFTSGAE